MSYRYFYHVRVDRSDFDAPEFLEQCRNEPITNAFYREVLRWSLADCCPWKKRDSPGTGWVRCSVYRSVGDFDAIPEGEDRIYEEDMTCVAVLMWTRDYSGTVRKHYSCRDNSGKLHICM